MTENTMPADEFAKVADMQIKFLHDLGEYREHMANVLAREIASEGDATIVQAKQAIVQQLKIEYNTILREKAKVTNRQKDIERHQAHLMWMYRGDRLASEMVPLVWISFGWFLERISGEARKQIAAIEIDSIDRRNSSFVYARNPVSFVLDAPEEIETILAMSGWLEDNILMPKRGSTLFDKLTSAVEIMYSCATASVAELETKIEELKNHTYTNWNPKDFIGLPHNQAVNFH